MSARPASIRLPAESIVPAGTGELDANLVGVWMLEFLEDREGLLPGLHRLRVVGGGVPGVAEVGQGVGLVVAVAEGAKEGKGVLVAQDG